MNTNDFLKQATEQSIHENLIQPLEQLYGTAFDENLRRALSVNPSGGFIESVDILRLLSNREMLNANAELGVDFIHLRIIPVFDTGDNDYIVCDLTDNSWCKFNIVDSIKFMQNQTLAILLSQ